MSGGGLRARAAWILLALFALFTLWRVASLTRPFFAPGWENWAFYDFRLWRGALAEFEKTGKLYDTDQPGYFLPGSHSSFKYPPTFAALMRPFTGASEHLTARVFLAGNAVCLLGFFAALLGWRRLRWWKSLVLLLCLLQWQPVWECLADLQMEIILLLSLGLSLYASQRGREGRAAAALGVAGAFKVYPWFLLVYFSARRKWRALLAGAAGAVATLALASLALPPRLSFEFFFRILPRIGGVSLSYDNVSLPAVLGRILLQMRSALPNPDQLDAMTLESAPVAGVRAVSLALYVLLAAGALFLTGRALRRAHPPSPPYSSALSLSVCLLLLLIPTSWLSYQTLLVLPLLIGLAITPIDRTQRGIGCLLGFAFLCGAGINSYGPEYGRFPALLSLLRSLIPVALWWLHLRLLPAAAAQGQSVDPIRIEWAS